LPELPEVEAARATAQRVAAGRRIVAVWCADDPIVIESSPARLRRALLGRRVVRAGRHGKHLWLELDRRPWLLAHFGMSGGLYSSFVGVRHTRDGERARGGRRLDAGRGVRLRSSGSRDWRADWPPRFAKLRLTLDDGGELAFADARRLGRIRLRDDPRREPPLSALGFDALRGLPAPARFRALLTSRAAPVKAVLLDQSFAAGVGNWVADEVLYQARIAPRRLARSLSPAEAGRLRGALRRVLATAVRAGADSDRYPRGWLFHRRWDPGTVTTRGEAIRRETIAGRTAAWVPALQH
jgi:formamidopyrimidine-DNA glycosylase